MRLLIITLIATFFVAQDASACQKLNPFYLDPEVILLKTHRAQGAKVIDARAIRSGDYKRFYFVQYEIAHPKFGTVYPTFAMNKPFQMGSVIYSMDKTAISLSGYGDGRRTKARFSAHDSGYNEVTGCLKR